MPAKIKMHELRPKGKADLVAQLTKLRTELSALRVAQVSGGAPAKLNKIHGVRKDIARVLTAINQGERKYLREHYRKKARKPLDLRPKKTRALRRALTPFEASRQTAHQRVKLNNFPHRKFAVKSA